MLGNLCVALDKKTKVRCRREKRKEGGIFCFKHWILFNGVRKSAIFKTAFVTRGDSYRIVVDGFGEVGFMDEYNMFHSCMENIFDHAVEIGQNDSGDNESDELEIRIAYLEL